MCIVAPGGMQSWRRSEAMQCNIITIILTKKSIELIYFSGWSLRLIKKPNTSSAFIISKRHIEGETLSPGLCASASSRTKITNMTWWPKYVGPAFARTSITTADKHTLMWWFCYADTKRGEPPLNIAIPYNAEIKHHNRIYKERFIYEGTFNISLKIPIVCFGCH